MRHESLNDLYLEQLRDLYSAEHQLVVALPDMARAATSPDLRRGFEQHLAQTQQHAERLEQLFGTLGESPEGKVCQAMQGLIAEGKDALEEEDPEVRDAALIAAAQRVEHYEITGYGTVATYAELLGQQDAAATLRTTLDEESQTDAKLTQLAGQINLEAMPA